RPRSSSSWTGSSDGSPEAPRRGGGETKENAMRTTILIAAAIAMALGMAGCGKRTHEDVQAEATAAAETLADAYAAGDAAAVDEAAETLKALADETKDLGDPPDKTRERLQAKYGERDRKAAEKLMATAQEKA